MDCSSTREEYRIPLQTKTRRRPPRFDLIGGAVCLDFINTLDDRFSSQPKELLASYIDLARFGEDAGVLSNLQVDRLLAASMQFIEESQRALQSAIELREAMYQVFWALIKKKPVPAGSLLVLNSYVHEAAQHMSLVAARHGGFEWQFDEATNNFDAAWWPIARSAAELLPSNQLQFVRACASKTCEWLFLDESKNHRRRWCDMTKCGNRAKVRRFYKRKVKSSG